jgi:hypothetical protein
MKSSKKFNKVVSGVLSTSILAASCTQYSCTETDRIYGNVVVNDADLGAIAIPISLKLKSEDVQYIKALQQISVDILNSPQKAKEFNSNPKSFLVRYGYKGEVNLDDSLLKITMALSDDDINNSMKQKDFTSFVRLCVEKGIISSSNNGIFDDDFYKTQLAELYKNKNFEKYKNQIELRSSIGNNDGGDMSTDEGLRKNFFLPFALVIAAAALVVAAIWAFVLWQEQLWVDPGTGYDYDLDSDLSMIDIYALKTGMEETYVSVDAYTERVVDESIAVLQEMDPDFFNNNSETEIRNLIKVNVLGNLEKFD